MMIKYFGMFLQSYHEGRFMHSNSYLMQEKLSCLDAASDRYPT